MKPIVNWAAEKPLYRYKNNNYIYKYSKRIK